MTTTLNPSQTTSSGVLSNGDLTLTTSSVSWQNSISTTSKSSGKLYFEVTVNSVGGTNAVGVGLAQSLPSGNLVGTFTNQLGWDNSNSSFYANNVQKTGSNVVPNNTTLCVAVDFGNTNVWYRWSNNSQWNLGGSDNPTTNAFGLNGASWYSGALATNLFTAPLFVALSVYNTSELTVNFGNSPFVMEIPSGFSGWDATPGNFLNLDTTTGNVNQVIFLNNAFTAQAANKGSLGVWEQCIGGTTLPSASKVYLEIAVQVVSGSVTDGVVGGFTSSSTQSNNYPGGGSGGGFGAGKLQSSANAQYWLNGAGSVSLGYTLTPGTSTWLGFAIDTSTGNCWVTADGSTWNVSGSGANPTTATGALTSTSLIGTPWFAVGTYANNSQASVNVGYSAFAFTVPSGFSPLIGGGTNINLTGVAATGAVGTMSVLIPDDVSLTGVAGTGHAGSITVEATPVSSLIGVYGVGLAGSLSVTSGIDMVNIPLNGGAGFVLGGVLSAGLSAGLTGASGQGAAGSLAALGTVAGLTMTELMGISLAVGTNDVYFSLRWSDDGGLTFGNALIQSFGATGEYLYFPTFKNLGQGRDRIFEISYSAPIATALSGIFVEAETAQS